MNKFVSIVPNPRNAARWGLLSLPWAQYMCFLFSPCRGHCSAHKKQRPDLPNNPKSFSVPSEGRRPPTVSLMAGSVSPGLFLAMSSNGWPQGKWGAFKGNDLPKSSNPENNIVYSLDINFHIILAIKATFKAISVTRSKPLITIY